MSLGLITALCTLCGLTIMLGVWKIYAIRLHRHSRRDCSDTALCFLHRSISDFQGAGYRRVELLPSVPFLATPIFTCSLPSHDRLGDIHFGSSVNYAGAFVKSARLELHSGQANDGGRGVTSSVLLTGLSIMIGIMIRLNFFTAFLLGCVVLWIVYAACYVSLEPSATYQSVVRLPVAAEGLFIYPAQLTDSRVPCGIHKGGVKQQEQQARPTLRGYYQTYPQQPIYR